MSKKDIDEFRASIASLVPDLRETAKSIRDQAATIRGYGSELTKLMVIAKKLDPGTGSIGKAEYDNLLQELERVKNLAISLKDDATN